MYPINRSKSKYRNQKVEVDGYLFDSKREANRYLELKLLERAGEISNLECQPRFDLVVNGMKICTYYGDFRYKDERICKSVVEDVKGFRTHEFVIKKKLVKAIFDIDVVEVK